MAKAKKSVHKKTIITETIEEPNKNSVNPNQIKKTVKKTIKETPNKPARKKARKSRKRVTRRPNPVARKHPADEKVEKALIENFIALQKVFTNLAVKFDNLSDQMSKLLNLFEVSAKSLAEKDFELESASKKGQEDLAKKLDAVLEQNKVIAKGVTMIYEEDENDRRIERGMPPVPGTKIPPYRNLENLGVTPESQQMPPIPEGFQMGIQRKPFRENQMNEYQKSIASSDKAEE